jgi:hypothetical protein
MFAALHESKHLARSRKFPSRALGGPSLVMSHGKGNLPSGHTNIMIRIAATTAKVIATAIVVCCNISTSLIEGGGEKSGACEGANVQAPQLMQLTSFLK